MCTPVGICVYGFGTGLLALFCLLCLLRRFADSFPFLRSVFSFPLYTSEGMIPLVVIVVAIVVVATVVVVFTGTCFVKSW